MAADRLTSQLQDLSTIIGSLGLNIARAQKEFNADYLNSIRVIMEMLKGDGTDDDEPEQNGVIVEILKSLSPARYQFTETTIDFSADLAETRQKQLAAGATLTTKAVAVNAAMTMGYGHDYRASARITSVIHAYHDPTLGQKLLEQAAQIRMNKPALPAADTLDKELIDSVNEIYMGLKGAPAPAEETGASDAQAAASDGTGGEGAGQEAGGTDGTG
ncbi:MAG: hypothetical protein AAGA95_15075 [Pseudomonadota bacterium]